MSSDSSSKQSHFIAIEGPIGAGKTTLARRLAETLDYELLLEEAERNPFLKKFYNNRRQNALATQLYFLFQRSQQLEELRQRDLFSPNKVSDFLIHKDRLFAKTNLDADEMALYDKVYEQLTFDAPAPDLVVYLQAPSQVLLDRVRNRGINYEQTIDRDYLEQINQIYSEFFLYYDDAPLLIVNAEQLDFAHSDSDFEELVKRILSIKGGRHYFNPTFL